MKREQFDLSTQNNKCIGSENLFELVYNFSEKGDMYFALVLKALVKVQCTAMFIDIWKGRSMVASTCVVSPYPVSSTFSLGDFNMV